MDISTNERDLLAEMRYSIQEFLDDGEGSPDVREYLASAIEDDSFLLIYLKGRKYRVKHAWETLKRNAEVRFNDYPEVFPENLSEVFYPFLKKGAMGILKGRDKFGRRVICSNSAEWNPDEVSIDQLTAASTYFVDRLLLDEDAMNNGIVYVQNNDGIGWKHLKQYTLPVMLRFLNILWYSYPLKVGGVYHVNCPSYARYINSIIKPFLSKKLKERFIISTVNDKKFTYLNEKLSPKILPKFLGGDLENEDAFEMDFFLP
ncbi:unnamed protein product [Orchesella dallaii]|uniref:CRAL-TRIO domain-containing protein n=1 Tax=Orchesella dallaii TaxID=48710 RepID=A0ABP1R1A4_9HEXA